MKTEMSSLDIAYALREMQDIEGARAEKIFQEKNQVHIALHIAGKGSRTLVCGGGMFFLSERTPPHSVVPTNFAMYLRKHIRGKRIRSVVQQGFDRIVSVHFDESRLVFELFGDGNALFVSSQGQIYSVMRQEEWKGRTLRRSETYAPPPSSMDAFKITDKELIFSMKNPKQLVAFLAREMSLGGTYSEEACMRAGIDKSRPCSSITEEEGHRIYSSVKSLLSENISPSIILAGPAYEDVVPFSLERYKGTESKKFPSFNSALEEYFLREIGAKKEREAQKETGARQQKLLVRKKEQEDAISRLEGERKAMILAAETITSRYAEVEGIIASVRTAGIRNAMGVSPKIRRIDEKTKTIFIDAGGGNIIALGTEKSIPVIVGAYYQQAKALQGKISRACTALKKTDELIMQESEHSAAKQKPEAKKRRAEWYHNFRWFISSGGFTVVGGRDASTNEILVKKHAEKEDLVFHTEIAGSPFVVVKSGGKEIDKSTILEAAQFAACHSRAWKQGVGSLDVFYVSPEQVTKKAPSGEYMGHGSFMVYGEKHWVKTELRLAAGFFDGELICGPVNAVSSRTKKLVLFGPGTTPASEIAKRIKAEIFRISGKEEQNVMRGISVEQIQKEIPFGSGELIKKHA